MLMVNLIVSDTQNNLDACYLDGDKVHQSSTTIKICEHCGTAYEARRSTKRFCSVTVEYMLIGHSRMRTTALQSEGRMQSSLMRLYVSEKRCMHYHWNNN